MTMTRSEAGLPVYELRKDVEDVSGPECKCVRMLLRQPMLSSFVSLQHPQSALHSSTSSNPFLPRPPPDNDIAQPVGLSQWTNRCGHVHRRSGCKKGNACTLHILPCASHHKGRRQQSTFEDRSRVWRHERPGDGPTGCSQTRKTGLALG